MEALLALAGRWLAATILAAKTSDEARAEPELAPSVGKSFLRYRDGCAVVVRFDPLCEVDFAHAIEAVKPV